MKFSMKSYYFGVFVLAGVIALVLYSQELACEDKYNVYDCDFKAEIFEPVVEVN